MWSLERPWSSWLLILPLLLWFWLRRRRSAPEQPTGTFHLWRNLALERAASAGPRGRRLPPWAPWLLASLVLAILALADPRRTSAAPAGRLWHVWVERCPGFALPFAPGAGEEARALAAPARRLERALLGLEGALAGRLSSADRVVWEALDRAPLELAPGDRPDDEWLLGRPFPDPREARAGRVDDAGRIWWTASLPEPAPARAGWTAAGGAAVPGPVAIEAGARIDWDGETLVRRPLDAPLGALWLSPEAARAWSGPLGQFAELFAAARGLELVNTKPASADVLLALESLEPGPGDFAAARVGRDGWWADVNPLPAGGESAAPPAPAGSRVWLETQGRPLLVHAPGRILAVPLEWGEVQGDPAAFALSLTRLFDRTLAPPAHVIPVAARADRGPSGFAAPASPPQEGARPATWERLLASGAIAAASAVAALLAALFAALRLAQPSGRRAGYGPSLSAKPSSVSASIRP